LKTWRGVVRGRTPKAHQSEPLILIEKNISYGIEDFANHCEEEPEAGGRIPSSPQTESCPSTAPQSGSARMSRIPSI